MSREVSISADKFKCFVRYMIQAAKQKRCVPYFELENIFGLGHDSVGWYAGTLGDYCKARDLPLLNSLIINSTTCEPSDGFESYQRADGRHWGEILRDCWQKFHVTSNREKQSQDFGQRDADVAEFLEGADRPSYLKRDG